MAKNVTNIAASVHQRLLNKAKESSRPFNELLQYYAIERFIYRLSKSPYAERFVLKGALMFSTWEEAATRPTMDIDLLGKIDNRLETITNAIRDICMIQVEEDGVTFASETVEAVRITEDAEYEGVRVRIRGSLGNAQVSLQIDIGFGDVIVPEPETISYPSILGFPAPKLKGYTMDSTIAEKFQAMVKLGILNSRMKDFYDIWIMSRIFDFKGEVLAKAVEKTFENRKTPINLNAAIFDASFGKDQEKDVQWKAFLRKSKLGNAPGSFEEVVAAVTEFLKPVVMSVADRKKFSSSWSSPGPWR